MSCGLSCPRQNGKNGIIEGAHKGLIYIDNSTIKPETARYLAEQLAPHGVKALDAPVSGGDIGAKAGTLTIMVGGSQATFDKVKPVIDRVFAFEELKEAMAYLKSGAHFGKICVRH